MHDAVYVGVEHWRHLHSWPCDRNRNEGSSQQQCRPCATDVCACEVTKRTIVQMVNVMKLRLALDDRTKYRNRVSAASDS